MIILGIDPGSRFTGFGVIQWQKNKAQYVTSGCIKTQSEVMSERLQIIFQSVQELVDSYRPNLFAIEQVFMAQNPDSALKLGQARGAAIVAATTRGLPVAEYSARQIKQSVVGKGNAEKLQVQHMVTEILKLSAKPQSDAADALAVALCHLHSQQHFGKLAGKASKTVRGRLRS